SVAATRPQVDAQVEVIRKLGLPIAPYQEELAAIGDEAEKARGLLDADPIGVRSMLEALRSRAEALIARAGRGAGLVQEAGKLATSLEGMRRQVAEHRSKGLRLNEEGGHPDPSLEAADRAHAGAVAALRAGQPDEAAKELDTGRSMVEQARSIVE